MTTTIVWFVLLAATGVSWWLGHVPGAAHSGAGLGAAAALILIAGFKVRLILLHFMELKHAPLSLRLVAEGWVFAVCAGIITLYALTPSA